MKAEEELGARFEEHSHLLERSIRALDARAAGLHTCTERACNFFSALAAELEVHDAKEACIDEAAEQRVSLRDLTARQAQSNSEA